MNDDYNDALRTLTLEVANLVKRYGLDIAKKVLEDVRKEFND